MSTYTPHPLALPASFSPDTLDVLTELSDVLQKVHESARESLQRDSSGDQQQQQAQQSQQQSQQQQSKQPQGQTPAAQTPASQQQQQQKPPGNSSSAAVSGAAGKKLTFKDVPGATDGIKHKLQRARGQIRALPDMSRTVDEQREEIAELEARIEKQRALLERLREGGLAFGKEAADRMET